MVTEAAPAIPHHLLELRLALPESRAFALLICPLQPCLMPPKPGRSGS